MSQTIPPIRLEFTYTEADVRTAARMLNKGTRFSRGVLILIMAVPLTYILLSEIFQFFSSAPPAALPAPGTPAVPPASPFLSLIINLCPYVVVFLFFWFFFFRVIRRRWIKLVQPGLNTVWLSDDGIVWDQPTSHSEIKWARFCGIREGPDMFLLLETELRAEIIPKRGMTPEQIAAIRLLLQSHVGSTHAFPVLPPK